MNNRPKTKAELHEMMAWVYRECEGTDMEGRELECIKTNAPMFDLDHILCLPPNRFECMLGLLEGRPVFEGDKVWSKKTGRYYRIHEIDKTRLQDFLWEIIVIEGVELPRPKDDKSEYAMTIHMPGLFFDNEESYVEFSNGLNKIIKSKIP